MKTNHVIGKLIDDVIPIALCLFVIFTTFNTPFFIKFSIFIFLLVVLIFKKNYYRSLALNFIDNYYFLIFPAFCILSFFLINDNQNINNNPSIINIAALSLLSIIIINCGNIYFSVMRYSVILITSILVISVFFHFFIFKSNFLSASIFFYDFEDENYATKNTLGILICLIIPYLIHRISFYNSILDTICLIVLSLSIFYLFSRTALVLYLFILLANILSFNKKLLKTTITIICAIIVLGFVFQITPYKYNILKGQSNKQIYSGKYYDTSSAKNVFSYNSSRSQHLINAFKGFLEKPFLGHGLTTFYQNHEQFDDNNKLIRKPVSHNDYAQILYELGLVGILLIFYLFLKIFYHLIINNQKDEFKTIKIIQFLTLLFSLNFINLIDHSIFWVYLSLMVTLNFSAKKKLINNG